RLYLSLYLADDGLCLVGQVVNVPQGFRGDGTDNRTDALYGLQYIPRTDTFDSLCRTLPYFFGNPNAGGKGRQGRQHGRKDVEPVCFRWLRRVVYPDDLVQP